MIEYNSYFCLSLDLPPPIGKPGNPCDPSPCGPYSRCLLSSQGYATCSCLPGYYGSPPLCKPECIVSAECGQTQACVNQKCVDPCFGICGPGSDCFVVNHNPICSCPEGYIGDPFVRCNKPTGKYILSKSCFFLSSNTRNIYIFYIGNVFIVFIVIFFIFIRYILFSYSRNTSANTWKSLRSFALRFVFNLSN